VSRDTSIRLIAVSSKATPGNDSIAATPDSQPRTSLTTISKIHTIDSNIVTVIYPQFAQLHFVATGQDKAAAHILCS